MTAIDRWAITGELVAVSALSLRTGAAEVREIAEASDDPDQKLRKEQHVQLVELGAHGTPIITATALKGCVRKILAERCGTDEQIRIERLLGHAPRDTDDPDVKAGRGGRAQFQNAPVVEDTAAPVSDRSMVRIDRGRGAAADKLLRTQKVVEPGSRFHAKIILDRVDGEDVALLLGALATLDGSEGAAIGGGTGHGFGRVCWDQATQRVERCDAAAIAKWLADAQADTDWRTLAKPAPLSTRNLTASTSTKVELPLSLTFDGFFIVSIAAPENKSDAQASRRPMVEGSWDEEAPCLPLLPGSSVKGSLRAQAERIWRTLSGDMNEDGGPFVAELFGTTTRAGALTVSDFKSERSMRPRRHELVAIDRFTGGAADGKKFSHDVFESPSLNGVLTLVLEHGYCEALAGKDGLTSPSVLSDAAIGLLALVLRDLAEGDVSFGYGTRRGYGRVGSVSCGEQSLMPLDETLGVRLQREVSLNDALKALREHINEPSLSSAQRPEGAAT